MKLNPLVYKLQLLKSCLHRGKQTIAFQEHIISPSYFWGGSRFLCHEQFIKAKGIWCSFWAPSPSLLFLCNPLSSDHGAMESQVKIVNSKGTAVFRCDLINEVVLLKRTHSLKPHIRILTVLERIRIPKVWHFIPVSTSKHGALSKEFQEFANKNETVTLEGVPKMHKLVGRLECHHTTANCHCEQFV